MIRTVVMARHHRWLTAAAVACVVIVGCEAGDPAPPALYRDGRDVPIVSDEFTDEDSAELVEWCWANTDGMFCTDIGADAARQVNDLGRDERCVVFGMREWLKAGQFDFAECETPE